LLQHDKETEARVIVRGASDKPVEAD